MEALIITTEEATIRPNEIKRKLDKAEVESQCRLCGKMNETMKHIVLECSMLVRREYKRRKEWVSRKIHWEICKKVGFDVNGKWCKHEQEKVMENDY